MRALKAIADALNVSAETLLTEAGLVDVLARKQGDGSQEPPPETEAAIRADERLSEAQRTALIAVYRSMLDRE